MLLSELCVEIAAAEPLLQAGHSLVCEEVLPLTQEVGKDGSDRPSSLAIFLIAEAGGPKAQVHLLLEPLGVCNFEEKVLHLALDMPMPLPVVNSQDVAPELGVLVRLGLQAVEEGICSQHLVWESAISDQVGLPVVVYGLERVGVQQGQRLHYADFHVSELFHLVLGAAVELSHQLRCSLCPVHSIRARLDQQEVGDLDAVRPGTRRLGKLVLQAREAILPLLPCGLVSATEAIQSFNLGAQGFELIVAELQVVHPQEQDLHCQALRKANAMANHEVLQGPPLHMDALGEGDMDGVFDGVVRFLKEVAYTPEHVHHLGRVKAEVPWVQEELNSLVRTWHCWNCGLSCSARKLEAWVNLLQPCLDSLKDGLELRAVLVKIGGQVVTSGQLHGCQGQRVQVMARKAWKTRCAGHSLRVADLDSVWLLWIPSASKGVLQPCLELGQNAFDG